MFRTEMVAVGWKGVLGLGMYCEDGAHPVTIGVELVYGNEGSYK